MTSTQFENTDCGYEMSIPVSTKKKSTVDVRTIFSGPFVLPDGYTIVSAIYDIVLPEKLPQPVTIKLEHCIDLDDDDEITASKMCFATAVIDLEKKVFVFNWVKGGTFEKTYASLNISQSCLVCVLYQESKLVYTGIIILIIII